MRPSKFSEAFMPTNMYSTQRSGSGHGSMFKASARKPWSDEKADLLAVVDKFYDHIDAIVDNLENDNLHIRFDTTAGTEFYELVQSKLNQLGYQVEDDLPEEQVIIPAQQARRFLQQYGEHLTKYKNIKTLFNKYDILDALRSQTKNIKQVEFSDDGKCLVIDCNTHNSSFYDEFIDNLRKLNFISWRVEGQDKIEIPTKHDLIHLLAKIGYIEQAQIELLDKIVQKKMNYQEPLEHYAQHKMAVLNDLFCAICNKQAPDQALEHAKKRHPQAFGGFFSDLKKLFAEYVNLEKRQGVGYSTKPLK